MRKMTNQYFSTLKECVKLIDEFYALESNKVQLALSVGGHINSLIEDIDEQRGAYTIRCLAKDISSERGRFISDKTLMSYAQLHFNFRCEDSIVRIQGKASNDVTLDLLLHHENENGSKRTDIRNLSNAASHCSKILKALIRLENNLHSKEMSKDEEIVVKSYFSQIQSKLDAISLALKSGDGARQKEIIFESDIARRQPSIKQ